MLSSRDKQSTCKAENKTTKENVAPDIATEKLTKGGRLVSFRKRIGMYILSYIYSVCQDLWKFYNGEYISSSGKSTTIDASCSPDTHYMNDSKLAEPNTAEHLAFESDTLNNGHIGFQTRGNVEEEATSVSLGKERLTIKECFEASLLYIESMLEKKFFGGVKTLTCMYYSILQDLEKVGIATINLLVYFCRTFECKGFILELILLLIIFPTFASDLDKSDVSVKWEPMTSAVQLGGTFILQCNITGFSRDSRSIRWTIGSEMLLLALNGNVVNKSKYDENHTFFRNVLTSNLFIKSFSTEDMERPYICAYGVKEYTKQLNRDKNFYSNYPTPQRVTSSVNYGNGTLQVYIKLSEINPIPKCLLHLKNNSNALQCTTENTSNFLYNMECRYKKLLECEHDREDIKINCGFNDTFTYVIKDTYNCSTEFQQFKEKETQDTLGSVLAIIFLTVNVLIVFFCMMLRIKHQRTGLSNAAYQTVFKE